MRTHKSKKNAQKQVNYKDRFYVSPRIPREDVANDAVYLSDLEILQQSIKITESYLERGTLVIWVEKDSIFQTLECLKTMGYDVLSELSAIDYLEN